MANISCEKIFLAIKSDDLISFSQLIKGNENLSFGRFPLLSVCYLYNSKNIIKKYEKTLGKINEYHFVNESFEIYQKFKLYAGRCLRLYLNHENIVSPLEMLAILHRDEKVKKCYKTFAKNIVIEKNLTTIYQTIYGQSLQISKQKIKIGKRPFNYQQKQMFKLGMWSSISFVAIIMICFALLATNLGVGTSFSVAKIQNTSQFVSALKSGGCFVIENNLTLDYDISSINFSGEIDGQNNTIYISSLQDNSLILNNKGTIKNLNIVYNNITSEISNSISLLAGTNSGTIDNVSITCNQLNLSCLKSQDNDIYITGFANQNDGYIKNCTIKLLSNVVASGEGECFISGFVGTNNGTISSCEFKSGSEVQTTEADLSGFAINNSENANISACKNHANLSQTSNIDMWSPNCSGIVQTNYGAITNCFNYGKILVDSKYEQTSQAVVFAGGIGTSNYGIISHCLNKGEIIVTSKNKNVFCGGITARSDYWVKDDLMHLPDLKNNGCDSNINVSTTADTAKTFVGGISGYLFGQMSDCYSLATFTHGNNQTKYFVGTCLGSSCLEVQTWNGIVINQVICISASNNFVLEQDNVMYQLSSLVATVIENGTIVSMGEIIPEGQDSQNKEIVTLATKDQIKQQEIYWTDEN